MRGGGSQGQPDRTRAFRLVTRLPRRLVVAAARRRLVRGGLRPAGAWLERGFARVAAGPAAGARLSLAHLPPSHSQAREIARGTLEPSVQSILSKLIEPGHVVYDIGANVGFFTVLAARLTGPEGRVVAFEPVPAGVRAIAANAELNGLGNVRVMERAAGAHTHRERLFVVADRSWSHLESRGRHPLAVEAFEVEVVAVDDLVASGELPPPDVIKLDVEGSEIDALGGLKDTIADHRPAIICELHRTNAEVADILERLGYRLESLDGPEAIREAGPNAHVLGLPSSP